MSGKIGQKMSWRDRERKKLTQKFKKCINERGREYEGENRKTEWSGGGRSGVV